MILQASPSGKLAEGPGHACHIKVKFHIHTCTVKKATVEKKLFGILKMDFVIIYRV
jgi:hypothetical protein